MTDRLDKPISTSQSVIIFRIWNLHLHQLSLSDPASIFVDHYSRLSYVHVHKSTGGDEAVEVKEAFETYATQRGVYVKHYHCDK